MTAPAPSAPITRRHPDELIVGFVSISDRASAGTYQDEGIPALRDWFGAALSSPWQCV
ncbi:MAG: molybdopterin adenylyltransferase, partial [Pseudomonadota bacterium]